MKYDNELLVAIKESDLEKVTFYLEQGADVNAKNEYGKYALHLAGHQKNTDILKLLIERGADLQVRDANGNTVFQNAILYTPCQEIVRLLQSYGLKFTTELHLAAYQGDLPQVEQLLTANQIPINSTDDNAYNALFYATAQGHFAIVLHLYHKGSFVEQTLTNGQESALGHASFIALSSNQIEIGLWLLEQVKDKYANQPSFWNKLLIQVCQADKITSINYKFIDYLLQQGASLTAVDKSGKSPLNLAVWRGNLELVRYLAKQGADINFINQNGDSCFVLASFKGHQAVVAWLFEQTDYPLANRAEGVTDALFAAILGQHLTLIDYLVQQQGASLTAVKKPGNNPLCLAGWVGNLEIIRYLAKQGGDINFTNESGNSCLSLASYRGHQVVVAWLLEQKDYPLINRVEQISKALFTAIQGQQHSALIDYLLQQGASLTVMNSERLSPLGLAVSLGNLELVHHLVKQGADINFINRNGDSCLALACLNDHTAIVTWLLEQTDYTFTITTAQANEGLLIAARKGHLGVVQFFLQHGGELMTKQSSTDTNLLMLAAHSGSLSLVSWLLQQGVFDVNTMSYKAICYDCALLSAIRKGHVEIVKYLLEMGASFTAGNTDSKVEFLRAAIEAPDVGIFLDLMAAQGISLLNVDFNVKKRLLSSAIMQDIVQFKHLVAYGLLTSDSKSEILLQTAIFQAVVNKQFAIAKYLKELGANITLKDEQGNTILHVIISYGLFGNNTVEVETKMEEALRLGANINGVDDEGMTALMFAVQHERKNVVQFLLAQGADIEVRNHNKQTVLQLAVQQCDIELIHQLIKLGADMAIVDAENNTLLHAAVELKNLSLLNSLLQYSASQEIINQINLHEYTALSLAVEWGLLPQVALLLKKDATVHNSADRNRQPLIIALLNGETHAEIVTLLLNYGAGIGADLPYLNFIVESIWRNNISSLEKLFTNKLFVGACYGEASVPNQLNIERNFISKSTPGFARAITTLADYHNNKDAIPNWQIKQLFKICYDLSKLRPLQPKILQLKRHLAMDCGLAVTVASQIFQHKNMVQVIYSDCPEALSEMLEIFLPTFQRDNRPEEISPQKSFSLSNRPS